MSARGGAVMGAGSGQGGVVSSGDGCAMSARGGRDVARPRPLDDEGMLGRPYQWVPTQGMQHIAFPSDRSLQEGQNYFLGTYVNSLTAVVQTGDESVWRDIALATPECGEGPFFAK